MTGPLADYVTAAESREGRNAAGPSHKPVAPITLGILRWARARESCRRRLQLRSIVDLPFEVPAHAANPQLHGTYRSFTESAGAATSDDAADVEFLVDERAQYEDFLDGRPRRSAFSRPKARTTRRSIRACLRRSTSR